jgi:hypothetical protein
MRNQVIYISTSEQELENGVFEVGGSIAEKYLLPRLLAYNSMITSEDLKRYYVEIIEVDQYANAKKLIKKILEHYQVEGTRDMYKMNRIISTIKIICDLSDKLIYDEIH